MAALLSVAAAAAIGVGVLSWAGYRLAHNIYHSLQPLPATTKQLEAEDLDAHPLFRMVPVLKGKLAWRQIGTYPTPIHHVKAQTATGNTISFYVKREDMAHPDYGGNKIRTLQHQLGACEAHHEAHPSATFHVVGSHGSNQCVATRLHGTRTFNLPSESIRVHYVFPDEPDLDNTLNALSTLSMGGKTGLSVGTSITEWLGALWSSTDKMYAPGGHNVTGVLGQVGAMLELAEQVHAGDMPDPEAIYLPYGSGCTTTGLILGLALTRHLGLNAFKSEKFRIVSVLVHHLFAAAHRHTGVLLWQSVPLSVAYSINQVCDCISSLGGPDFKLLAQHAMHHHLELVTDQKYVGTYGAHSSKSLPATTAYDASAIVTGKDHCGFKAAESQQWLCGHFAGAQVKPALFWQTKSLVQPHGQATDEAAAFSKHAPGYVKRWAEKGKSFSIKREGSYPDNYRQLMTEVR